MQFAGAEAEIQRLKEELREFERKAIMETQRAARVVMMELFGHTPVWEGTVIRNYVWTMGGGAAGGEKPALGAGDPGPTGSMPLGAEPRRGANEEAARGDMESVLGGMKRLTSLRVTNTAAHFDLVDNGSAPTSDRARNPGGVMKVSEANAKGSLEHWK